MNTALRKVLAVSAAAGLALNSGCYAYVPATAGATPAAGAEIRVQLNADGTTELARYLGPRVSSVDGKLSSVSSDGAMVIAPAWVQIADGARQQWTGEGLVTLPSAYVATVRLRTLDRPRSTIAAVAIGGSIVAIAAVLLRAIASNGASTTGGTDGGPIH